MCGLVGIIDLKGKKAIGRELLDRMNQTQTHRGPDGAGLHLEPGVGLGHRRLSIIDLAGGHQPLSNEDGSVIVVYNGEIYNFEELTTTLQEAGHQFRTRCDTEVIVHAWEQWGPDCVKHFRGMFAFGLWDRNRETLFLARDRLGIKPLYYAYLPDGTMIFGSELKSLLAYPDLDRTLDPRAIEDYFTFGYVPEPRSVFSAVSKLAPGHYLEGRRGGPSPSPMQYWDLPYEPVFTISETEATKQLLDRIREAVRIRLISEVPLGAFLSGGVDSSGVVAVMAQISEKPVTTCSISFKERQYDEIEYANRIAARYQTAHHLERVESEDFDLIDALSDLYDEPFADSSALPTYRVCQLARRHVTVALSGDGGDETLAGYRRYRWHRSEERVRSMLPLGLRRLCFGALATVYPKADWAPRVFRAKATFEALARDSVEGYLNGVSILPAIVRRDLFSADFRRELQGYQGIEVLRQHAANAPQDDPVSAVQYLDTKTYLPGDILTKVDRASMAHSLEVRVPLLDHFLVEWVARLPRSLKLKGSEGKYLLKRALEPHVDKEILYRRKMGFAVPLALWFRGPLRQRVSELLVDGALRTSGIFRTSVLERLIAEHQSGRRDHSSGLWALVMFDAFLRRTAGIN